MPIQILPAELANQIAAGEVVERPASVVKELVENCLDAGATRIDIDIERGGHKRIRVRDNGSGIEKQELALALSRHATSKIKDLSDLEHILSMGFRGEALASISSVSRLTLQSRPTQQEQGWQAQTEGREMQVQILPVAHPEGTTVDVQDIFYNTPARRKFLRTEKTEFMHIEEVVKRLALCHFQISFRLNHNGKLVRHYPAVKQDADNLRRVTQICQKRFCEHALWVEAEYRQDSAGMKLSGWLGTPAAARTQNDLQHAFINQRVMRDKVVNHAIRAAFEGYIDSDHYPAFVLYLDIDPEQVDVNVHPAKHEVRFHRAREVHDFIYASVAEALQTQMHPEELAGQQQTRASQASHDYIQPLQERDVQSGTALRTTTRDRVNESDSGHVASYHLNDTPQQPNRHSPGTAGLSSGKVSFPRSGSAPDKQSLVTYNDILSMASPEAKLSVMPLGQKGDLVACQERVYFLSLANLLHQVLTAFCEEGRLTRQPLLMPVAVEATMTRESIEGLLEYGFVITKAGPKLILKEVPAMFRDQAWSQIFPGFCSSSYATQNPVAVLIEAIAARGQISVETKNKCWQALQNKGLDSDWLGQYGKVLPIEQWLNSDK
ncbi:MAG: DNA mismatch repair endonuclease MutL [Aestuariibacter sp.]